MPTAEEVREYRDKNAVGTAEARRVLLRREIKTRLGNLRHKASRDVQELIDIITDLEGL